MPCRLLPAGGGQVLLPAVRARPHELRSRRIVMLGEFGDCACVFLALALTTSSLFRVAFQLCAPGRFSSMNGSTTCEQCSAGYVQPQSGGAICVRACSGHALIFPLLFRHRSIRLRGLRRRRVHRCRRPDGVPSVRAGHLHKRDGPVQVRGLPGRRVPGPAGQLELPAVRAWSLLAVSEGGGLRPVRARHVQPAQRQHSLPGVWRR